MSEVCMVCDLMLTKNRAHDCQGYSITTRSSGTDQAPLWATLIREDRELLEQIANDVSFIRNVLMKPVWVRSGGLAEDGDHGQQTPAP